MLLCRSHAKAGRRRCGFYTLFPVQPAKFPGTFQTDGGSFIVGFLINDSRVKVVSEVVPVFHQALCRAVVGFNASSGSSLGQCHPGEVILIELSYLIGFILFNTLLDFVAKQGETLTGEGNSGHKEGAAEAIENNIRKKVIEKVTVNPRYYAKMSEILDKLIEERKQGVLDYAEMLEKYIKLAKDVDCPEDNDKYPESIRKSKALMAIYDNTGEDEKLALRIHKAVKKQALSGFRDNQVVVRRIKKALFEILGDDSEVERIYKIIEKQEEY